MRLTMDQLALDRLISDRRRRGWHVRSFGDPRARRPRMIRGIASTTSIDDHGTRIFPGGLSAVLLPLPLFVHHKEPAVGEIFSIEAFDDCVIAVGAIAATGGEADHVWSRVIGGELKHLSIRFDQEFVFGDSITRCRLREISLVCKGSNPDTFFAPWRAPVRLNG